MEETGSKPAMPVGAAGTTTRPVVQHEIEFRARLEEYRPRMIQWAREVEKPLSEVGDLRAAHAHLRHFLAVSNGAALVEELVLFIEYQGARRILHVPVANRIKTHLKEIQKVAGGDERLGLSLTQMYAGYVTRLAKIAQSQRGSKPVQPQGKPKDSKPVGPPPQGQQGQGRPRGGGPGGPPGGKGRPGRGPKPEAQQPQAAPAVEAERPAAAPAPAPETPAPAVAQAEVHQAEAHPAPAPAAEPAPAVEAAAPASEPVAQAAPAVEPDKKES